MGALIDASVLIAAERGELDLEGALDGFAEELALSVVTASELLHGVHLCPGPSFSPLAVMKSDYHSNGCRA